MGVCDGGGWKRARVEHCDVHEEINKAISHESFHILVELPLLCHLVHVN